MSAQRYRINSRPQLIDLNNDLTNFKLNFQCTTIPPNADFNLYVATQTELDKTDISALPFKNVTGEMGGNIIADEDIYENYFLIVSSESEIELDVMINIVAIEPKSKKLSDTETVGGDLDKKSNKKNFHTTAFSWTPSNIVFWVVFSLIVLFLIYYLFYRKSSTVSMKPSFVATDGGGGNVSKSSHSIIDDINDL